MMLFTWLALVLNIGWAHGENKPGPHGGHVQMPGPFHTEVVPVSNHEFMIFLLDMDFKNPTLKDSSVIATLRSKNSGTKMKCEPMGNHFHCTLAASQVPQPQSLVIKAVREKAQGNEAAYALPLKEWPAGSSSEKKSSHQHH